MLSAKVEGEKWQVPRAKQKIFFAKKNDYCLVIPVYNEGDRIRSVLKKVQPFLSLVDVILVDKGSTDGSTAEEYLRKVGVRTLFTMAEEGRLSSQLRVGYAFALQEGYKGILTIDGNDKDEVSKLPEFIKKLENGYDFVQASRYAPGGQGVNTPLVRHLAVRMIHVPVISFLGGFRYTDTTQGYRAYSRQVLADERLAIFREVFVGYELLGYLSVKVPRHGYKVTELPVTRTYPAGQKTPTKISFFSGNWQLMKILWNLAICRYDPK